MNFCDVVQSNLATSDILLKWGYIMRILLGIEGCLHDSRSGKGGVRIVLRTKNTKRGVGCSDPQDTLESSPNKS